MESLNQLPFLDIMEFTTDRINNDKNILPSVLKILKCLRLSVGGIKNKKMIKKIVENFALRCSNCGKEIMIDLDLLETDYQ